MQVLLFGMIAERAEVGTLELNDLSYSIAVDRSIVHGEMELSGDEEIAVLPPFAGG